MLICVSFSCLCDYAVYLREPERNNITWSALNTLLLINVFYRSEWMSKIANGTLITLFVLEKGKRLARKRYVTKCPELNEFAL